ncbi:MAG: KH domain-containing protein [Candidatus Diapherotrites archaeon]
MSKDIVVPGELLSTENKELGSHTFGVGENIFADCLGIKNEKDNRISVVPLRGRYIPVENDVIIGIVKNEKFAGYDVEINSFYPSFVNKQDLREPLSIGSIISARIVKVNEMNEADIGMVRSIRGGEIVNVTPVKVPRIIGKNASMLNAIKNGTGSTIMVGRNGLIWINGGNTVAAMDAIKRIEDFAHAENLTHDIQCFLAVKTGQGIPDTRGPSNEEAFGSGDFHGGDRGFRRNDRSRGGFNSRPYSNFRSGGRPPARNSGGMSSFNHSSRGNFRSGGFSGNRSQGRDTFRPSSRFRPQYEGNNQPSFDRRKRFPRDDRVRGDEDPSFE